MKNVRYLALVFLGLTLFPAVALAKGGTIKNSIVIQNNKNPEKEGYYKDAIYKANMEGYRLKEKDVTLQFAEGFQCVLLSAQTLKSKGINIDVDSYLTDFPYPYKMPVFSLTGDGHLIATYQKISK